MTTTSAGVIEMFEALGMTPEQIAADQSIPLAVVKDTLLRYSDTYRQLFKSESGPATTVPPKCSPELFTADHLEQAKECMANLLYGENEGIRYRASRFIIDELKGRNDAKVGSGISSREVNIQVINLINDQLTRARAAKQLAKDKTIDLKEQDVKLLTQLETEADALTRV
jgi:hypothetical protein